METRQEIRIKQLGLAAFIQMNGAELLMVVGKEFVFATEKSVAEWRVAYNNSCCMKHDALVCELRHHLKKD